MVLRDREVSFQLIPNGLNAADRDNIILLISTVSENQEGFTRREYEGALESRRAMHLLGFLSERDFENMIHSNMIVNFPVTFDNIKTINLFLVLISPL